MCKIIHERRDPLVGSVSRTPKLSSI